MDLDEFNFAYVGLSLAAGAIAFFASSRVPDISKIIPIGAAVFSVIAAYLYLVMTER